MELADVERALKRPGAYFFEDGLCEIVVGLWIFLTVALPQLLLGWGDISATLAFGSGFCLPPAILAAKERWVHPRTGRVAYDPANVPSPLTSLRLSPGTRPAVGPAPGQWAIYLSGLLPGTLVCFTLFGVEQSRRLGVWGAGGHLLIGSLLSGCLLLAWWRWKQRRWIALAVVLALLATAVASSSLSWEQALAFHAAGIAIALIASGTVAFNSYLRHAPKPLPHANGR